MAERPIVNPTPKQKFQSSKVFIQNHRELMQDIRLDYSLDVALQQYQRQMCDARITEGNLAAVNHFKMQGAIEFVTILKHLAEMPELTKTTQPTDKLNYA